MSSCHVPLLLTDLTKVKCEQNCFFIGLAANLHKTVGISRDSSTKNTNYVINDLPLCRSKPVRPLFIFGTQIKIFFL